MTNLAILWRRLDQPGHESARLLSRDASWHLAGTAVFAHDGQPCRLDYLVVCDPEWRTVSATVAGWVGAETIQAALSVDAARRWRLNGTERPEVAGCIDLDLNFSPSTNLLPIRRLGLAVGEGAEVRAAWFGFPSFTLEPLDQRYRRTGVGTYRYESAGGRFVTEIEVNAAGFVTRYPGFWQSEVATGGCRPPGKNQA
ncbi:MAG: putative glycolipid-binding domain-containing protein [Candidatus Rokubacteria bacterium]|nr:putative glycolipid-binding domain-containing protein [Candidatus Rokubacteria bacterium]